jgi:hypothetical protein
VRGEELADRGVVASTVSGDTTRNKKRTMTFVRNVKPIRSWVPRWKRINPKPQVRYSRGRNITRNDAIGGTRGFRTVDRDRIC